jgi:hypothetical protein
LLLGIGGPLRIVLRKVKGLRVAATPAAATREVHIELRSSVRG